MAGALTSRAQALQQLRLVADYFRRTEPHSPVAYLADKAARWGDMPLHAWLRAVVKEATAADADIIKIAAVTQHEEDLARLESFLAAHRGAPLCLLGMGALGPESRKRLPAHGSCLTYGYVDEANVPGQLSSAELMDYVRQLPG